MLTAQATGDQDGLIAPLLTAVVGSILGTLGLWLQETRARRNAEALRRRELEVAQAYLGYLVQWFSARSTIAPDDEIGRTRAWAVDVLDGQLRAVHAAQHMAPSPSRRRSSFWARTRRLLLLHPLRSFLASLVRALFYLVAVIVCGTAPSILLDARQAWGDRIGASLLLVVTGLAILSGLWHGTVRLAANSDVFRSRRTGPTEPPAP
ncbi:hypothetical protein ACFYWU_19750 [Streptomyces chrestomyceticus]|uniref:hypothetical protein n=1 Tax=Streptomyces chrestomyceticus TaxID=68185 RepID=UPI0036C6CD53